MNITPPPSNNGPVVLTKEEILSSINAYIEANPGNHKAEIFNSDIELLFEIGHAFKDAGYSYHLPNVPTYGDKYKLTIKW